MPNPSQAHPVSSKDPHQDINNMDVLCTFKINKENQNLDQTYLKIYELNSNHDQDAKLQSGTSSIPYCLKCGLSGHSYSFYLQNQDKEPKFVSWVYQRTVTLS